MPMNVGEVVEKGKSFLMSAAFIAVGAFVARFLIGIAAGAVPMVGAFAPEAMLLLGIFAASTQTGIVRDLGVGAGVAGVFACVDKYVPTLSAQILPSLTARGN